MKEETIYTDTDIGHYESIKNGETTVEMVKKWENHPDAFFRFNEDKYNKLKETLENGCGQVTYIDLIGGGTSIYRNK